MRAVPSVRTRQLFRELLTLRYLGYIDDVFLAAGIQPGSLSREAPSGHRRARVEEYYAGVDWTSSSDVERALRAFEHVLMDAEQADRDKLADALRADGLAVDAAGHITAPTELDGAIDPHALEDPDVFFRYERRIQESIERDPELAIGSCKELVEAVCKLLLEDAQIQEDPTWSAERLFKEALRSVDLSVVGIAVPPVWDRGTRGLRRRLLSG